MAKAAETDPGVMSEVKKMKFKEQIRQQLKQVISKCYGQVDEDMRGTLKKDDDYERAYNEKDVIALQTILKAINFN